MKPKQVVRTPAQLGQLLQAYRKVKGMTQQQLGFKLGISQKRQSAIELDPGRITVDQLLLLLPALGLELVVQEQPAVSASPKGSPPAGEW